MTENAAELPLSIGEFARRTRLTTKALRVYDRIGLLPPSSIDEVSGYRRYHVGQVRTGQLIRLMRGADLGLADIGLILDDLAVGGDLAVERLKRLAGQIDVRNSNRKRLIGHIQAILREGDDPMFPIATRRVPARRVMSIQRRLHGHETDGFVRDAKAAFIAHLDGAQATGPFTLIFHGPVNAEEDGPLEVVLGCPDDVQPTDRIGITEPAHDEVYTTITKAQWAYPAILAAYDAVACSSDVVARPDAQLSCRGLPRRAGRRRRGRSPLRRGLPVSRAAERPLEPRPRGARVPVDVRGLRMYYEITGEGEPLVLINGLGLAVSETGRLVEALARHHRVLAFDNRGAGRTDKPDEPYSIPQMAEDIAGLMRALEFERAHVVGISLGGRIAIDLALAHPEVVRSLVLASTCARVTNRRRATVLGVISRLPWLRGRDPQPRYAFSRQRHASDGYDRTDRLAELRLSTLVIHGRRDHIVPLQFAEELAAAVPGARLVRVDGGHIFPLIHPAAFADHVVAFSGARDR